MNLRSLAFRLGMIVTIGIASVCANRALCKEPAQEELSPEKKSEAVTNEVTRGALRIVGEDATVIECPLQHTRVETDVSGFIARVKLTQVFHNPTKEKIEATYVFPLPHQAAVDDMTMVIGERKIVGIIKRRDAARHIYQQAISQGQTAALLDQQRPNIFTQTVGNIEPGQKVEIEISYIDVLKYDTGSYEFHFPMVVGPRYNPQSTGRPADVSKISPPVLKPGTRTGHDVSISVDLDAGVPIQNLTSANHKVHTIRKGDSEARIRLLQEDSIPNKDFIVRYSVVGKKPTMALLAHTGEYSADAKQLGNGYFMLMIQPQEDERLKKSPPREIIFLVDVSGSMRGNPTAKVRESMQKMLGLCRDKDTFQVVTFASRANKLFDQPVAVNEENIKKALDFSGSLKGSGGTEMLKGVQMAIDEPIDKKRLRIIVMLTDGYIGNEAQIIEHVGKNCGDQIRFWAIGIGLSPNMFLIDGVARQGGGMGKKIGLNDEVEPLTTEVMTRIQRAQLANLKIDWADLKVAETFPTKLPELWAGRPVIVYGRFKDGGKSEINISGTVEGDEVTWPLTVSLPENEKQHDVLAKVWARQKIEDLMQQSFYADSPAVEEEVTAMALDYRLMSQYTSFVAVDAESAKDLQGPVKPPRRMAIPVPLPDGTQWDGFFGDGEVAGAVLASGSAFGGAGNDVLRRASILQGINRTVVPRRAVAGSIAQYEMAYRMQTQNYSRLLEREQDKPATALAVISADRRYVRITATPLFSQVARQSGHAGTATRGSAYDNPNDAFGSQLKGKRSYAMGHHFMLDLDFDQKVAGEYLAGAGSTVVALSPLAGIVVADAQQSLANAQELEKEDDLTAALRAYRRAFYLDCSAANFRQSLRQVAWAALMEIERLRARQVAQWNKSVPKLATKLDLVLRDSSIDEALKQIGGKASLAIDLQKGSVEDAAQMLLRKNLTVTYLDLRRATVAQALDWILQPLQLTWTVENGKIIAQSERRSDAESAWVYDVSLAALPTTDELGDPKDYKKATEAARKVADDFANAVRTSIDAKDDNSVVWFAPGQLLVFGNAEQHTAIAKLLDNLSNKNFVPPKNLMALHAQASTRAAKRSEHAKKLDELRELIDVAGMHDEFGWKLLTAATAGELDLEALTELQVAWRHPATKRLLSEAHAVVALKSWWMIHEAAASLPAQPELQQLDKFAGMIARPASDRAVVDLSTSPKDSAAVAAAIYAGMARRSDGKFAVTALAAIEQAAGASEQSQMRTIARCLMTQPTDRDRNALSELIQDRVQGEDVTFLTALSARRLGGDLWQQFRTRSRDLLSKQPLRGEVVVLINRLTQDRLASLAAR